MTLVAREDTDKLIVPEGTAALIGNEKTRTNPTQSQRNQTRGGYLLQRSGEKKKNNVIAAFGFLFLKTFSLHFSSFSLGL